jgi:hypothetical protein
MKTTLGLLFAAVVVIVGCEDDGMGSTVNKKVRLDYYISPFQAPEGEFEPQIKVQYEYDTSDKLKKYTVSGYNPDSKNFDIQRTFEFLYENARLSTIKGFLVNETTPYITYQYQYSDSRISKILENNNSANITSNVSFTYAPSGDSVKAVYVASNGGSFEYHYRFNGDNISNDKTTRSSQLCSTGIYSYDQKHNPFHELGYTDFFLDNLSVNNKLTENVNYKACAFPELIPLSYTYEYNEKGYPVKSTTTYKTSGDKAPKSTKDFFYK